MVALASIITIFRISRNKTISAFIWLTVQFSLHFLGKCYILNIGREQPSACGWPLNGLQ